MSGTRFQSRLAQYCDENGNPLASGVLVFYETGTSILQAVYLDSALGDEAQNPLSLDADGRTSTDVFLDVADTYRVVLKDANGTTVAEEDPVAADSFASALAAHNADVAAHVTATTTNRGVVSELANDAEAQAMADTSRVLTPSNLAALTPTTTRAGLVERATTAEIETATDDVRYISPLGAQALQATSAEISAGTDTKHFMGPANFAAALSKTTTTLNGKMPGLTFKIGTASFGDVTAMNHYIDVTFPEAFGTACLIVLPIFLGAGADSDVLAMGAYAIVSKSTTACRLYVDEVGDHTQNGTVLWLAIGY